MKIARMFIGGIMVLGVIYMICATGIALDVSYTKWKLDHIQKVWPEYDFKK